MRIPNRVALRRFAITVLEEYEIATSLLVGLQKLISNGNIQQPLSCYRDLIVQRDRTLKDLTEKSEENHRDTFYFCLRLLIITEWKFYRINYLDIPGDTDALSKAATLHGYTLEQILDTRFGHWDKYHHGTIRDQAKSD